MTLKSVLWMWSTPKRRHLRNLVSVISRARTTQVIILSFGKLGFGFTATKYKLVSPGAVKALPEWLLRTRLLRPRMEPISKSHTGRRV